MKAGPYTITQAEAIRRTKQLLASCEPKTNSQQFAHKIFEALLLAHKAGEKSPGALLAACFATDRGEDIGEPPDGYGGLGWMYPEAMIANLELSCKDIARKAEETVSLLKRLARATFESARVFLELKARCEDLERHIHTGEVPAFAMCVIKEMRRCPKEDFVTINEIAAQPGKGSLVPGWKFNKLILKARPDGRKPAEFAYGCECYTVPAVKAWDTVCRLIEAGAFDTHGLKMKSPSDLFKREHRAFFTERMGRNGSGWFIKTL